MMAINDFKQKIFVSKVYCARVELVIKLMQDVKVVAKAFKDDIEREYEANTPQW